MPPKSKKSVTMTEVKVKTGKTRGRPRKVVAEDAAPKARKGRAGRQTRESSADKAAVNGALIAEPQPQDTQEASTEEIAKQAAPSLVSGKKIGGRKKVQGKKRKETYSTHILRVLKQVHPDTRISTKAMSVMNSLMNDIFHGVAGEASKLAMVRKRSTLSSREIQTAVRLYLPGELAKHAVSEGTKAVAKFTNSNSK